MSAQARQTQLHRIAEREQRTPWIGSDAMQRANTARRRAPSSQATAFEGFVITTDTILTHAEGHMFGTRARWPCCPARAAARIEIHNGHCSAAAHTPDQGRVGKWMGRRLTLFHQLVDLVCRSSVVLVLRHDHT